MTSQATPEDSRTDDSASGAPSAVAQARQQQTQIYGAPLADILRDCAGALGLNQSGLAQVLGVSQPMLSQLINGHRIKIANPVADQRLRVVSEWAQRVHAGEVTPAQAMAALDQPYDIEPVSRTTARPGDPTAAVQEVFRASASALDYLGAADLIAERFPDIAQLLRVYGTARLDVAAEHTQTLLRRR